MTGLLANQLPGQPATAELDNLGFGKRHGDITVAGLGSHQHFLERHHRSDHQSFGLDGLDQRLVGGPEITAEDIPGIDIGGHQLICKGRTGNHQGKQQ